MIASNKGALKLGNKLGRSRYCSQNNCRYSLRVELQTKKMNLISSNTFKIFGAKYSE
jgi:hypothetical protein